jgi:small subunit ribosomal protein S16
MSVVIRLMRAGAKKRPFFRMVAADSRRQRDGRFLEILGHYNPLSQPYELVVHKDKVERWIQCGAQPSEQVASLLRSLDIPLHAARAAAAVDPAPPAGARVEEKPRAKAAPKAKRAAPRKASERKVRAKAARKTGKTAAPAARKKAAAKA